MEEQPSTSGSLKRLIPQELHEDIDVIARKRPRITGIYEIIHLVHEVHYI